MIDVSILAMSIKVFLEFFSQTQTEVIMSGTKSNTKSKNPTTITEAKLVETSTSLAAETKAESVDIATAYQVAKAQNEVLLALINRYFDFNETAMTQGFEFLNKLLVEGLDFAKANLESRDAHTEVRLEIELETSRHRQELEKDELANRHEIAMSQLSLDKSRQELDTKIRLQELAESQVNNSERHNLEKVRQHLRNLETLAELRKNDSNHEMPEIWKDSFLAEAGIQNINAPISTEESSIAEQKDAVTEKLKEWGYLDSPMTKDAANSIENIITTTTFSNKKSIEKAAKKETTPKKPKGTPKV